MTGHTLYLWHSNGDNGDLLRPVLTSHAIAFVILFVGRVLTFKVATQRYRQWAALIVVAVVGLLAAIYVSWVFIQFFQTNVCELLPECLRQLLTKRELPLLPESLLALILYLPAILFFFFPLPLRAFDEFRTGEFLTKLSERKVVAYFLGASVLGAWLLYLPGALVETSASFSKVVFTAVGLVSTTGLNPFGSDLEGFTPAGQVIAALLIALGSLGVLSGVVTVLKRLSGLEPSRKENWWWVFYYIVSVLVGWGLLWYSRDRVCVEDACLYALFNSLSAYGNVGIFLGDDPNPGEQGVVAALVLQGSLSPLVMVALFSPRRLGSFFSRKRLRSALNTGARGHWVWGAFVLSPLVIVGAALVLSTLVIVGAALVLSTLVIVGWALVGKKLTSEGFNVTMDFMFVVNIALTILLVPVAFWLLTRIPRLSLDLPSETSSSRLDTHSRMILFFSFVTLLVSFIAYAQSSAGGSEGWTSWFYWASAGRTAGYVPVPESPESLRLTTMLFMFIGGAPGGMAGGVKLTTIAVVVLSAIAVARGRENGEYDGRQVSHQTLMRATAVLALTFIVYAGVLITLLLLDQRNDSPVSELAFYTVSAVSTVGASLKDASIESLKLHNVQLWVLSAAMLIGRVGPLVALTAVLGRNAERATTPTIDLPLD